MTRGDPAGASRADLKKLRKTNKNYEKIQGEIDRVYDRIEKVETEMEGKNCRLRDLEKKDFLRNFIESVEIYPEKMDNGRICKQLNFNFPVYYDGEVSREINLPEIRLLNENTVETIVSLSKGEIL